MSDQKVIREMKIGPITIQKIHAHGSFDVRMDFGNGVDVWQWPCGTSPMPFHSMGEELAKALALFDGRFEIRRYK